MSSTTEIELKFAVPFDHTLFVEAELLGAVRNVELADHRARLEFPRDVEPGTCGLRAPISTLDGSAKHLPDRVWGIRSDAHPQLCVNAVLIVVPATANINFDLANSQIDGDDIRNTVNAVIEWFDSFVHWLRVITAQSLDPVNPDPRVIPRRSGDVIVTATAARVTSLPVTMPNLQIIVDSSGPASERLVSNAVLDVALQAVGKTPPISLDLLASARMAARRSDYRRTLVDAGTAVEAALSQALGLGVTHQFTLGGLIIEAEKQGLPVPDDTQSCFVDLRNDAVHRGSSAPKADIMHALEIAEDLVAIGEADLIHVASMTAVRRPQTFKITIIRKPEN